MHLRCDGSFEIYFKESIQERDDSDGRVICLADGTRVIRCKLLTNWDISKKRICLTEDFAMKLLDDGYLLFKNERDQCLLYLLKTTIASLKYCSSGNNVLSNINPS